MSYKFNKDIESKLEQFDKYLKSKKYSKDTIRQYRNYAGIYLEWIDNQGIEAKEVSFRELSDFVFFLKNPVPTASGQLKTKVSTGHLRKIVLAVRHYHNSLDSSNNPAAGLYIRGHKKSILNDIIPYNQLIALYKNYQTLNDRDYRNKVILGILIYQALTTAELHQLEPNHIRLKEGKIYVSGSGQTKSRILDLEGIQLLELQEYLLVIRPRMLENINDYRSGRKVESVDPIIYDRLFFSERGNDNIKNSLYHLFRAVRKTHPKITSGKVIRSTVIAEWLKSKDIRIVQYMAGHQWVSSTERYNVFNLQELKDSLGKHHPLK